MTIVIVEDEIGIREGLIRLLSKLGDQYQVIGQAKNGAEGLSVIRATKPDAVISDIQMPEMGGLEMLQTLHQEGYTPEAILLTAFSDFDYARKGIQLGVSEYILKPATVKDVRKALEKVAMRLTEKEHALERFLPLDKLLYQLATGHIALDEELQAHLWAKYEINANRPAALALVYWDGISSVAFKHLYKAFDTEQYSVACAEMPDTGMMLVVAHQYKSSKVWGHKWNILCNEWTLQNGPPLVVACTEIAQWSQLKNAYDHLLESLDWSIVLKDSAMIRLSSLEHIRTREYCYPIALEKEIIAALCNGDSVALKHAIASFLAFLTTVPLIHPKNAKEAVTRLSWSVWRLAAELGLAMNKTVDSNALLQALRGIHSYHALSDYLHAFLSGFALPRQVSSHVVQRACGLIYEFHASGITLEEIASQLHMSPEYLSRLFQKELGIGFSTFVKRHKIDQAKKLLLTTPLKLHEIALKIGYSDPKYFSRVFKEQVGMLPAEYRRLHI